jgi:hypothetical protein
VDKPISSEEVPEKPGSALTPETASLMLGGGIDAMAKNTKTLSSSKKAQAPKRAAAKRGSALDRTSVETIRIPPEDVDNLEALRLFVQAYEKL